MVGYQLDDSQSLHTKWLFHQTSIYKWLALGFQVAPKSIPSQKERIGFQRCIFQRRAVKLWAGTFYISQLSRGFQKNSEAF